MSQLALDLIREAKEQRLTSLDLGNCGLTELPDELFELVWLEELILSNTWMEYNYQSNKYFLYTNPSSKKVNEITILKAAFSHLQQLKKLVLSSMQVADLSPLSNLTALQFLNCHGTQATDLSPLANLTALQYLDCGSTQVTDLSPLANLTALQYLDCGSTQVTDLSPLANSTAFQHLNCSSTRVTDLSPLANLTAFQSLNCGSTQVTDLSPLANLTTLQSLNCTYTRVTDLSPLANLIALQSFVCTYTRVKDLSPIKKILEKGELVLLSIQNCPLTNPPISIAQQGNEAILRYWAEQERVGKQKVNEARLLLVGQGHSGKTTLKEKLRDRKAPMPAPDATTLGIEIETLTCKDADGADFTVQVWDFGGQNIQKYAHQFFMSDSVVYAVISNTREQNQNFQYWLNIIELLGKESPFFIVQNEKDGHAEPLKDITQIQERFPNTFKSVEQVNLRNADTDPRFDILEKRLFYEATQLPHTQKEYLTSFINVRRQLETLAKTQQTIPYKQFKELCAAEGIKDTNLMDDYASTFTYLGIALHFADDIHLKAQVFLRPKWIIDALFAILYAKIVEDQNGRFSATDAETIWVDAEYDGMHGVLLQLMVRFQLCYAIPNTSDYIVPQRLHTRTEPFVSPVDATHIVYRYRFLPSGILTQLTCRLHTRIEGEKAWNDAVQFSTKNGDGRVFVRENNAADTIEIFGFGQDKATLINTVVDTIDDIHYTSKFGNLKFKKLVPCPCTVCAAARAQQEESEFFDYDFLIGLLQDGETESDRCKLSKKKFPIREILKASTIRMFKIDQIKELLAKDRIEDALKILKSQFPEDSEVIIQMSRLVSNNRVYRMNQSSKEAFARERSGIIRDVLTMLTEWESEN